MEVNVQQKSLKARVQRFGSFLSGMVIPNIGAFIAWGVITALFIPTGWWPNKELNNLVSPMITYLLPLLIGYTGGHTTWCSCWGNCNNGCLSRIFSTNVYWGDGDGSFRWLVYQEI